MFCKKCGAEIPADASACPNCGAPKGETKFCKHCGQVIDKDCVVCPKCGKQVETVKGEQPSVVINNTNNNVANATASTQVVTPHGRPRNKWVALLLCLFLGFLGAHKFYEGKIGMGILYICTFGLIGIGIVIDFIKILFKPNPYYI